MVWVLITGIVASWYMVLAPYIRSTSGNISFLIHAVFGHWLLMNIVFHYYKVTTVKPGTPPTVRLHLLYRSPLIKSAFD
jgi:palmitoyltransferase